ncbi:MAG: tRNA (guanosine(18)-2'-O)-methyltransferase TrmH [Gemmatimonadota bacterium]
MNAARFRKLRDVLDRRQPDLTVLMERVHKPHNFSAILRNCDAVGVLEAHAVPTEEGLEVYEGTSAGTSKWVRVRRHPDVETGVRVLHEAGFRIVAAHPEPDATDYRDVDFTGPTAIMVGAELHGLSERGLALADRRVVVPMRGMVRSLNVSVATALLLFEAHRQREEAGLYQGSRLEPERYRRVLFEWAYPRVARRYRERDEPYPGLDEHGRLLR